MTIDPETLMAYADGELDPLAAKRVERAIAADPALADQVAAQRRLRDRLAAGFAPVADEAVPDRLTALLATQPNVTPLPTRSQAQRWWPTAGAIAASLVVGVLTGQALRPAGPVAASASGLVAAGSLAQALDTQLASTQGSAETRVIASFRDRSGALCRVFSGRSVGGIACRSSDGWALRRTESGQAAAATEYRQAGSPDAGLLAAAQDMMTGDPLDAGQERAARDAGWR